jgi:hypothetical protein
MKARERRWKQGGWLGVCMLVISMVASLLPMQQATVRAASVMSWQPVGSPGFTTDKGIYTSIAIDSSDAPYIAFEDFGNANKATVMKYVGGSWIIVGNAGFSVGNAVEISIAIDSSGTPYVAYGDIGISGKTTVKKYNVSSNSWITVGSEGFSAGQARSHSIAIDSSGTPYVAYRSGVGIMMKYDASSNSWVTVGNAGFSADAGANYTSMAIDSSDTPYVVYDEVTEDSDKATVKKYDKSSNSWVTVGNAGFSASTASFTSMKLDSSGTPYVVYRDAGSSNKATVKKYDVSSNSWVTVGNAGFSLGIASYTSIAIDGSGIPYVGYTDGGYLGKVNVMSYDRSSNSWVNVGSGGFSAGSSQNTSIALDSYGNPYVAYADGGYSGKATVMKYPPIPKYTVSASAATVAPGVGADDAITLKVWDSKGGTDTTFSGAHDVTVSGYAQAPDGSYGSFNGTALTAGSSTISVTFANGVAIPNLKLNKAGTSQTLQFSVANVATPATNTVSIMPVAGNAASMALTTGISAPASNGGTFAQQPVVTLLDAYGNTSTGDSSTVVTVSKKDTGTWSLTGTATATTSAGVATFTDLGATNEAEVTGAQLAFAASGLAQITSTTVTLPAPALAQTVSASAATTTPETGEDDAITLTVKNALGNTDVTFSGGHDVTVSGNAHAPDGSYGSFNGMALTAGSSTISVTFASGVATPNLKLNKAGTSQTIGFSVVNVATPATNTVSIMPVAGNAASMALTTGISAPASNGGTFAQQPVVTLLDAYGNTSTGDSSTVVTASKKDTGTWTLTGTATATASAGVAAFTDLGTTNTADVTGAQLAFDAAGLAQITSQSVILPWSLPGAPILAPATLGDSRISLTWDPVIGSTGYRVFKGTASGAYGSEEASVSGSVYSYEATGLANGTMYYFVIKATNPAGDSAASNEVNATPRTVPAAPADVTAAVGNGQAIVNFTAPANGGSAITSYEVTAMPGNHTVTGAGSPITVTGLSNGTTYTFTVKAFNSAGSSTASGTSNPVTPSAPFVNSRSSSSTPTSSSTPASQPEPAPAQLMTDVFSSIIDFAVFIQRIEARVAEAKKANMQIDYVDIQGHWVERTADIFTKLRIIEGYADGTFKPDASIKRAEFAVILNRVFEIQGDNSSGIVLNDIGGSWAKDAIQNLVATGVIHGYEDGTFRPNNTITREEMVVMISRILNLNSVPMDTSKGNFNDLNDSYAANEIQAVAQAGVFSGKGNGVFDPKGNATRGEALQIILNMLELHPQLKTLLESLG